MDKLKDNDLTLLASSKSVLNSYKYELEYLKELNSLLDKFELKCRNVNELHRSLIQTRKRIQRVKELAGRESVNGKKKDLRELRKTEEKILNKKERIESIINDIQDRILQAKILLEENKPQSADSKGFFKTIADSLACRIARMRRTYAEVFQVGFLNE